MATTIIDQLIVTLGLDPTKFTQGQRQAAQALRNFQNQANASANQIQSGAGNRLTRFWQNLGRPVGQAQQNLTNLGNQSRRVGTSLAAGFNTGTTAIQNMVTAGLTAYGVVKTLHGAVDNLNKTISGGAQTGRTAGYTGVSPEFLSNFAIGANVLTNADKRQTEETLFGLKQFSEQMKLGQMNEQQAQFMARLGGLGISLDQTKDPEQIQRDLLTQLHEKFSKMSQPEAQAYGANLGFGREFTQAIQQYSVPQILGAGAPFGISAEQVKMFQDLQRSINEFEGAWDKLIRRLVEDHPKLREYITTGKDWLLELEKNPAAMGKVETAIDALSIAFGVTLVAGVGKAMYALNSFWALPVIKFLASPIAAGPLAFLWGMKPTPAGVADENKLPGADPRVEENFRKNARPGPTPPKDTRSFLERVLPYGWGGKDRTDIGKTVPIPGQQSGRLSIGDMKQLAVRAGFQGEAANDMAAIAMAESRGNPMAHNDKYPDDSYGITQINALAHGQAAKEALGNPQRAMELAFKISKGGTDFAAWSAYKSGAYREHLAAAQAATGAAAAPTPGVADISKSSGIQGSGQMDAVQGMIVHHTGGGRNVNDVLNVFKSRGVASNFVIDRDGNTFQVLPDRVAGRHIMNGWGPKGEGKSNRNMEGVEIIAKDDRDVTDVQKRAAEQLIAARAKMFGYDPKTSVFGHGEVNPGHRQDTEGMKVTSAIRGGDLDAAKPTAVAAAPTNSAVDRLANLVSGFSLVRSAQAAERVGPSNTNITHDIDLNGPINVHTQATDASGIARDMSDAVRQHLDVSNANSGLEY